uniref:AcidPPc domain-containing protein n=1 Tax=Panagrellus redivivus TaxID=6233 RepID=A0A7E4VNB5_PANRE
MGSPIAAADDDGLQSESVVYISDMSPEIGFFPRFYLDYLQWNRMRFTRSHIHMEQTTGQCVVDNTSEEGQSRETCIVEAWLHDRVIEPFNCTLFYFASKTPHLEICSPGLVVNNYDSIGDLSISAQRCLPSCSRFDTSIAFFSTKQTSDDWSNSSEIPAFRLEASYTYLQYESYQEVLQTSPPSFISKIGGQFGLFCGISVITIVQVLLSIAQEVFSRIKAVVTDEPPVYYGTLKG